MCSRSALVAAFLAVVMIIGTEADRKHCFCDLRYSTTQLAAGDSVNSLPVLQDLPDPSYHHWLSVGCRRVLRSCPNDCMAKAHEWMGGSQFTGASGPLACESVRRNAPPSDKIYVYASYEPSVCGDRSWQYIAPLCCWELSFAGYAESIYLHNDRCLQPCPPTNPNCQ